jgi:hypothetical protein
MRFRNLRIAWSVFWGLGCVLLIVLWVRSYFRAEFLERVVDIRPLYGLGTRQRILNRPGSLDFWKEPVVSAQINVHPRGWRLREYEVVQSVKGESSWRFEPRFASEYCHVRFPHYFALLAIGVAGVLPWLHTITWRFSLRTLLIATTLVAVMLGLAVYAVSKWLPLVQ